MYRREIQYITKRVREPSQILNYIYHVGQYLPDWHPWENYKDYFIDDKRTNGFRELFAIELPWIVSAFGDIDTISSVKSKNTSLEINYNDNYMVTIEHRNGHKGVICVDVISRKAVRELEVYGEQLYIRWSGTPASLVNYDINSCKDEYIYTYESVNSNQSYSNNIIENMYTDEIIDFLNYVRDDTEPLYSFEKDYSILEIIDEIEREFC